MRIEIKLGGDLEEFLPDGASGQRADLDVERDATPAAIMRSLGLPEDETYLVALNGAVVPPAERVERALDEDDLLEIMPALRGG